MINVSFNREAFCSLFVMDNEDIDENKKPGAWSLVGLILTVVAGVLITFLTIGLLAPLGMALIGLASVLFGFRVLMKENSKNSGAVAGFFIFAPIVYMILSSL